MNDRLHLVGIALHDGTTNHAASLLLGRSNQEEHREENSHGNGSQVQGVLEDSRIDSLFLGIRVHLDLDHVHGSRCCGCIRRRSERRSCSRRGGGASSRALKFVSDGGPDGETVNAGGSKDSKKEKGEKSGHRVTSWQISVVLIK